MKLSSCCGVEPAQIMGPHDTPDSDTEDIGICACCGEHCEYVEEVEEKEEAFPYNVEPKQIGGYWRPI